jgi:N-acetylglucosaminyl-diphospho-decaprenol L-rhamnosyltransferase
MAAGAQMTYGGSPHLLITAEVVGWVEVPHRQHSHPGEYKTPLSWRLVSGDATRRHGQAPVVVVVVSWNTRELLDRCLQSLQPGAQAGLAEVWVVDNASSDGSAVMVRGRHAWVQLVDSDVNLGYGAAVNLVAEQTSSRWLACANSDVALRPGALETLVAAGEQDSGAGIVAPRLLLPDGTTQHSAWAFPTLGATAIQNLGPLLVPRRCADRLALRGAWNPDRPRRIPWAVGAFLLVRRAAWDAAGGFDSEHWMSAEDLDLGWRMREAGWATRYEPRAVVEHEESAATGQVWGRDLPVHWQRCAYAWMLRRYGRPRTVAVGLLNLVGSGGRLALGLARLRLRPDDALRAWARWTLVHTYALAPRRTLDRYR